MDEAQPFKLILLGSINVGKTSCIECYVNGQSSPYTQHTIGARFDDQILDIDGVKHHFQIWDTAGQDTFISTTALYCHGAKGAAILFDLTNRQSFLDVPVWVETINNTTSDIPIVLMGNKCDLLEHTTPCATVNEIYELANQLHCQYYQVSAKTGNQVEDAINYLAIQAVLHSQNQASTETPTPAKIDPNAQAQSQTSNNGESCC